MASVWYVGTSDVRSVSAAEWTAVGVAGVDNVWSSANGWSIPKVTFSTAQLALLDRESDFNIFAPDGPRNTPTPEANRFVTLNELAEKVGEAIETSVAGVVASAIAAVPSSLTAILSPSEVIAEMIDFGSFGQFRGAIAGDSTMNDGNDPPRKLLLLLKALTPTAFGFREFLTAGGATPTYGTTVVVRTGDTTADVGGTILTDNFNRTGELSGSTTSGGQTWAGTVGSFSGDGANAVATGTNALMFNSPSKTMILQVDQVVVTTSPTTARNGRLIVGATTASPTTGGNYIWVQDQITTAGILQLSLWKRIAGVNTQIGATITNPAGAPSNSATPVTITSIIDSAIQAISVTFKIAGQADQVISGTITEDDVAALGTYAGISGTNTGTAIVTNSIQLAIPFTAGSFRGLDIYNGAVGGTSLDYQTAHMSELYPASRLLDFIYITQGHNSTALTDAAFVSRLDAFVTAFKAIHPETAILIASQNPQFAPATSIAAHAQKQRVLRKYAMTKGYEYLPIFEAFTAQADGGLTLVNPGDGIHPTTTTTTDITTWCGNLLMTAVWLQAIKARRRVGTQAPITTIS